MKDNEKLWHSLPEFPGASLEDVHSASYHEGEGEPIAGYTTNPVYEAPADASAQDIIDFYVGALSKDWKHLVKDYSAPNDQSGRVLVAGFCNEAKGFSVNTDGMFVPPHTFELSVDHERYKSEVEQASACR